MLAHRINGSHPVNRLRNEMERLFDEAIGGPTLNAWFAPAFPAVNMWDEADKIFVEAEMPGLKLDDIELLVQGDELTIKGQRGERASDDATYHRRERGTGHFSRVFRLPVEVDAEKVEASFKDGVLLVTMPKSEKARPRKITVKALGQ